MGKGRNALGGRGGKTAKKGIGKKKNPKFIPHRERRAMKK
jgi:hypothetical protein